jgi:hypothetical protein
MNVPFQPTASVQFSVGLIPFGVWDVRRVIESGEKGIWLKYTDLLFGKIFKIMRDNTETGNWSHPITQFIVIFDFKGFTMRQLASFGSNKLLHLLRRRNLIFNIDLIN